MKNFKKTIKNQRGSSIIELLIATMIVGSLVTAMAVGMTYTIKNSSEVRYRDASSVLAQDGIEYFRKERDVRGWDVFFNKIENGKTMCINTFPSAITSATFGACGSNSTFTVSNIAYKREAKFTKNTSNGSVKIEVTVTWNVGGSDQHHTTVTQVLKNHY